MKPWEISPTLLLFYLKIVVILSFLRDWNMKWAGECSSLWLFEMLYMIRCYSLFYESKGCIISDWVEIMLHSFFFFWQEFGFISDAVSLFWKPSTAVCFIFSLDCFQTVIQGKTNTMVKMAPCCWSWHQALLVVLRKQHHFVLCLISKTGNLPRHLPFYTTL